jgi:hypothetical protein
VHVGAVVRLLQLEEHRVEGAQVVGYVHLPMGRGSSRR